MFSELSFILTGDFFHVHYIQLVVMFSHTRWLINWQELEHQNEVDFPFKIRGHGEYIPHDTIHGGTSARFHVGE